jgi:hypothetical protein
LQRAVDRAQRRPGAAPFGPSAEGRTSFMPCHALRCTARARLPCSLWGLTDCRAPPTPTSAQDRPHLRPHLPMAPDPSRRRAWCRLPLVAQRGLPPGRRGDRAAAARRRRRADGTTVARGKREPETADGVATCNGQHAPRIVQRAHHAADLMQQATDGLAADTMRQEVARCGIATGGIIHCNRRYYTLQQAVVVWDDGTTVTANDATVDRSSWCSAARHAPSARSSPCRCGVVAALHRLRAQTWSLCSPACLARSEVRKRRSRERTHTCARSQMHANTHTHTLTHARTHAHKRKHARTQMQARTHAACDVLAVLTCSR